MKDASTFFTSGAEGMLGTESTKTESVTVWAIVRVYDHIKARVYDHIKARVYDHIKARVYGHIGPNDCVTSMRYGYRGVWSELHRAAL